MDYNQAKGALVRQDLRYRGVQETFLGHLKLYSLMLGILRNKLIKLRAHLALWEGNQD
jgi:hypothetical protein